MTAGQETLAASTSTVSCSRRVLRDGQGAPPIEPDLYLPCAGARGGPLRRPRFGTTTPRGEHDRAESAMGRERVAVLISGRGSNMAELITAARRPDYPADIALVLSNRP